MKTAAVAIFARKCEIESFEEATRPLLPSDKAIIRGEKSHVLKHLIEPGGAFHALHLQYLRIKNLPK